MSSKTVEFNFRWDLALFLTVPLAHVTDNWITSTLVWVNVGIYTFFVAAIAIVLIIKGDEFVTMMRKFGKVPELSFFGFLQTVVMAGMLYYCGWEVSAVIIGACYVIFNALMAKARRQ